jgi:putative ABC transport system permease protein
MRPRSGLLHLAFADLWLERRSAVCTILGMAAVLAPLVVLAGLRAGVVEGLREALLKDPRVREISSGTNRDYPAGEVADELASAVVELRLIPTAPGDPLLTVDTLPTSIDAVVLTAAAAARLHVKSGAELVGSITRSSRETRERIDLVLHVQAVAAPAAYPDPAAFVTLELATFKEDYQNGIVDTPAPGRLPEPRPRSVYAGFRLYARHLEGVPVLDAALRAQGLDVNSRAGDVANLLSVDRSLGLLLLLVAGLGGSGYLVSLGATLWAGVEHKRAALAMLRFLGVRAMTLAAFPVLQALALALAGSALALLAAETTALILNHLFAGTVGMDRAMCRITSGTALGAVLLTVAGASLAAAAAGARLGRIEPWEGIVSPS